MNLEATHPFAGRHAALVLTESGAWENHLCKSGESIIVAMRDRRGAGAAANGKCIGCATDVHYAHARRTGSSASLMCNLLFV